MDNSARTKSLVAIANQAPISFSDNDIEKMKTDLNYAKKSRSELQRAIASGTLDPITAAALTRILEQIEQIIKVQNEIRATSNKQAEEVAKNDNHQTKNPKIKTDNQSKIDEFFAARAELFKTIKTHLESGNISAVNDKGEEVAIKDIEKNGIPKDVVGFAGKDPKTTREISQGVKDLFNKMPPQIGHKIVERKVTTEDGKEFFFYAMLMVEEALKHSIDPLSITKEEVCEVIDDIENSSKRLPNASIAKNPPLEHLTLDYFKANHVVRAITVANAEPDKLHKFHEAQIIEIWKEHVESRKSQTRTTSQPLTEINMDQNSPLTLR